MGNDVLEQGSPAPTVSSRKVERTPGPRPSDQMDEVQRLLQAGQEEIRDRGSVEPRVVDIVRRAGLSNKAFYRHFRSKDELLLAILEDGIRNRVRAFDTRLAVADSALERVRLWIRGMLEQTTNPEFADLTRPLLVYQARLTETLGDQLWGHRDHLRAPLERALEAGLHNGELAGIDPKRDAEILYSFISGWMHGRVIERKLPTEADARAVEEFAVRGLLRQGPS